jgi:hypothetical protein
MNGKKFWLTVLVVFVLYEIINYIIYNEILLSTLMGDMYKNVFRSQEDMMSKMWIMWLTDLVWCYFFVFFFAKGYENKGIGEGVRYGIYMGIFVSFVMSFNSYSYLPYAFSLSLQMFVYGFIESIILGIAAAIIYKPKAVAAAA